MIGPTQPPRDDDPELTAAIAQLHASVKRIPGLEQRTAILGVLGVLVILLMIGVGWLTWQAQTLAACQVAQYEQYLASNRESRAAADARDVAQLTQLTEQRELFRVILNPASTDAQNQVAQEQYAISIGQIIAAIENVRANRAANPFPTNRC